MSDGGGGENRRLLSAFLPRPRGRRGMGLVRPRYRIPGQPDSIEVGERPLSRRLLRSP